MPPYYISLYTACLIGHDSIWYRCWCQTLLLWWISGESTWITPHPEKKQKRKTKNSPNSFQYIDPTTSLCSFWTINFLLLSFLRVTHLNWDLRTDPQTFKQSGILHWLWLGSGAHCWCIDLWPTRGYLSGRLVKQKQRLGLKQWTE